MAPVDAAATSAPPAAADAPAAAVVTAKRAAKKLKKGGKPKADADADGDDGAAALATIDHPYLSFLHKRIRLYKKKMEKIRALEAVVAADGKVLNEQQRELVASKFAMEKIVTEFESLRDQFVEVFHQEEAEKKAAQETLAAAAKADEVDAAGAPTAAAKTEPETPAVVMDVAAPEVTAVDESTATEATGDAFAHVEDLLKTLHVVNLHQALGKEIPMVLDFFSKVLLGNTRPVAEVSFEENLAESLAEAKKYLERSDKIMACDSTYSDLRAIVDQLAQMDVLAEVVETPSAAEEADEAEDGDDTADKLPEINFFTDSLLDSEDAADDNNSSSSNMAQLDESTDDKVDERANAPEEIEEVTEGDAVKEEVAAPLVASGLAPPPSSIPAPPMSFAAAAASTPANAPVSAWGKVPQSGGRGKNSSANGDGGFKGERRPRPQLPGDESSAPRSSSSNNNNGSSSNGSGNLSSRPSGLKDERRPRVDRALRKPNSAIHQPPHAHASPQA